MLKYCINIYLHCIFFTKMPLWHQIFTILMIYPLLRTFSANFFGLKKQNPQSFSLFGCMTPVSKSSHLCAVHAGLCIAFSLLQCVELSSASLEWSSPDLFLSGRLPSPPPPQHLNTRHHFLACNVVQPCYVKKHLI